MKLAYVVSVALLANASISSAAAAPMMSGNKLLQLCGGASVDRCVAYIQGVADHESLRSGNIAANGIFCIREGVADKRLVNLVKAYLAMHPGKARLMASVVVSEALEEAFPCRRAG